MFLHCIQHRNHACFVELVTTAAKKMMDRHQCSLSVCEIFFFSLSPRCLLTNIPTIKSVKEKYLWAAIWIPNSCSAWPNSCLFYICYSQIFMRTDFVLLCFVYLWCASSLLGKFSPGAERHAVSWSSSVPFADPLALHSSKGEKYLLTDTAPRPWSRRS